MGDGEMVVQREVLGLLLDLVSVGCRICHVRAPFSAYGPGMVTAGTYDLSMKGSRTSAALG